jgi:hypothetical protein
MTVLSKDAILQAPDMPVETVSVPEWGGQVCVRTMSGTDRDAFEASLIGKQGEVQGGGQQLQNVRARLVALTVCDKTGVRLFTDADIPALGAKSAKALDRVFAVAQRLNGIGQQEVDAAKNG